MRVGMILDKVFPPDPRVENEALSLIAQGYDVFLFCITYQHQKLQLSKHKGITLYQVKSNNWLYKWSALVFTFPVYRWVMTAKIREFIKDCNIEVLHVHDLPIASAVVKANQQQSLKMILDLHENRPEIMKLYPHLQSFWKRILIAPAKWKKAEEILVQKFDHTIVVTQEAKDELLSRVTINQDRIVVVANTIHDDFIRKKNINHSILERYQDKIVLLYIGDTAIRRGLLTAIKAMPILINQIPNLKLVIVGSSTEDVLLKKEVASLNLAAYVDFEGWQSEETFASYIQAAFIGLSPLHSNLHHDTTYANKIFQYMCFGKPVVLSNVLAQQNLIEKFQVGCSHLAQDEHSFAFAVLQLYNDDAFYQKCACNANHLIQGYFSMKNIHVPLIKLYQQFNKSS